jgi:hypothetical protein
MAPKKPTAPVDPRSEMTDRDAYMTRALHTAKIVPIVAVDIAKREGITSPVAAMRRALRFLKMPDHYDPEVDTMTTGKIVEKIREELAALKE